MNRLVYSIFLILVLLCCKTASAQPFSACFTATQTRGCTPFTFTLNNCSGVTTAIRYQITGPETITLSQQDKFTLTKPGLYTVYQVIDNGIGGTDGLTKPDYIEVLPVPQPNFEVFKCEAGIVRVKITDSQYEEYKIDFGDGSPIVTTTSGTSVSHTYTSFLSKKIRVTGNYVPGNCGSFTEKTIEPFSALAISEVQSLSITQLSNTAGEVELIYTGKSTFQYKILQSIDNAPYLAIDSTLYINGEIKKSFKQLNTESNIYCYKVAAYDDCSHEISSEELCTIPFSVTAQNNSNNIDWAKTSGKSFQQFSLIKNNVLLSNFTSAVSSYKDKVITCGSEYCYQLEGKNSQNGLSRSAKKCVVAISTDTPPTIATINSTFEDNQAKITWTDPTNSSNNVYQIYKGTNTVFTQIGTTQSTTFTESSTQPSISYDCYKVKYSDKCGNVSPFSKLTCPIVLNNESGTEFNILKWNAYIGDTTLVIYTLEKLDKNKQLIQSILLNKLTAYKDAVQGNDGVFYYRIKAETAKNYISYSTVVKTGNEMFFDVPTAFSPNNDGQNDVFLVKGKFIEEFKMTIYNNFGEVIFFSNDINIGWDGTFDFKPVPIGAYAVVVEVKDKEGKTFAYPGTVTLLK